MDWQTLIPDAPSDWELLPLNGKKRPIDHNTGALLHDWTQSSGYDIDAICEMNGVVRAVGVKLGPASGGLLAVDFDGPGSTSSNAALLEAHLPEVAAHHRVARRILRVMGHGSGVTALSVPRSAQAIKTPPCDGAKRIAHLQPSQG